ncbi:hypothetical protein BSPLISOX_1215 [uncultured Gammaproteobacteria bacterium]|nr:hypothetical protein [uncultured Gammaproteobacteria bacterium]VVH64713.1 hypothetical protein BSPLISOX_1215 [uncultured Gammaproteobacteria bacterium]
MTDLSTTNKRIRLQKHSKTDRILGDERFIDKATVRTKIKERCFWV